MSESSDPAYHPNDPEKQTKKDQILALHAAGVGEVDDIALMTGTRPSYVNAVLQEAGEGTGYFDLYTSTNTPMNVYSKFFAGKLGFKDEETARKSIEVIAQLYHRFELAGDRAGQHHAMLMALTMYNRARWTGKHAEATIYRDWLLHRLGQREIGDEPSALN